MSWRDGGGESGRSERQVVKGSMSWREVVEGSLAVKRHSREKATLTVAVQSSVGRGNRLKNVAYSQDLMKNQEHRIQWRRCNISGDTQHDINSQS